MRIICAFIYNPTISLQSRGNISPILFALSILWPFGPWFILGNRLHPTQVAALIFYATRYAHFKPKNVILTLLLIPLLRAIFLFIHRFNSWLGILFPSLWSWLVKKHSLIQFDHELIRVVLTMQEIIQILIPSLLFLLRNLLRWILLLLIGVLIDCCRCILNLIIILNISFVTSKLMNGEVALLISSLISTGEEEIDEEKLSKSMHFETFPSRLFFYN